MLPSMPILFTRDSQDAFGNKIEPSTSFFQQNLIPKTVCNPEPPKQQDVHKVKNTVVESKSESVKKEEVKHNASSNDNILETALVRTYYTKVQSRFSSYQSVPTNKFVQFHNILKTFDPSKETPVDLYRKVEQLFGENNKDIVEEFLLFLKPGQAAEIGRFMEHFSYTKMTNFINMLQITFARKPTVLRKIFRAISTGINTGSSEAMKTRVLPHLRSNPRLTQLFKSLFPDERPPNSLYANGSDEINEMFLTNDKGYDVWEFNDENDGKRKLDAKQYMDTVYLNGRVFLQHGRMLRAATVTYPYSKEPYRVHARRLAPDLSNLSPPESDEERSSPKRSNKNTPKIPPKRTKKQIKSTKNVKDVNDNTKHKDCTSITSSPKVIKSKAQATKKTKDSKKDGDKNEVNKRDKKDKNHIDKKDENKAKQAKLEVTPAVEVKKEEIKSNSWTREEDKTMLQVLKGEAGSEEVFGRIRELLPHRSVTDIKNRFRQVMNLLQQMAGGEVT